MFKDIDNFEGLLESLRLERVLFKNESTHDGNFLNADDYYIEAWEHLSDLSDESIGLDWTDSTLYKFSFPGMVKFYDLCKVHSRINKINFKKNPYVTAAEEYVKTAIYDSPAENFAWNLWIPKKIIKKKRYIFLIETGCYFDDYVDMLNLLYEIRDYYDVKSKELEKELSNKTKIIKLPTPKTETRKAA